MIVGSSGVADEQGSSCMSARITGADVLAD